MKQLMAEHDDRQLNAMKAEMFRSAMDALLAIVKGTDADEMRLVACEAIKDLAKQAKAAKEFVDDPMGV